MVSSADQQTRTHHVRLLAVCQRHAGDYLRRHVACLVCRKHQQLVRPPPPGVRQRVQRRTVLRELQPGPCAEVAQAQLWQQLVAHKAVHLGLQGQRARATYVIRNPYCDQRAVHQQRLERGAQTPDVV